MVSETCRISEDGILRGSKISKEIFLMIDMIVNYSHQSIRKKENKISQCQNMI